MREPTKTVGRPTGPLEPRARAPRRQRRVEVVADALAGEDPRVILGRTVHRCRIRLAISQEELANRVGLDRTYVSGIERGVRNPTLLVLLRLAWVLDVSPVDLLAGQAGVADQALVPTPRR